MKNLNDSEPNISTVASATTPKASSITLPRVNSATSQAPHSANSRPMAAEKVYFVDTRKIIDGGWEDRPTADRKTFEELDDMLQDSLRRQDVEPSLWLDLKDAQKKYGNDHQNILGQLDKLAEFLEKFLRADEALPLMLKALNIEAEHSGADAAVLATRLDKLGHFLKAQGNLDDSVSLPVEICTSLPDEKCTSVPVELCTSLRC